VPADFRQWCHGYVVTSHKAQGWTADHVVVAAERFTSKGAYVACSRGRRSCTVHTPDKARKMERFPEGNRRAAMDVLSDIRPKKRLDRQSYHNMEAALHRSGAAHHYTANLNQSSAVRMRIAPSEKRLSQSI
jgi:hypothetical protein